MHAETSRYAFRSLAVLIAVTSTSAQAFTGNDCAELHNLIREEASHRADFKLGLITKAQDVRGYSITYQGMGFSERDAKALAMMPFRKEFAKASDDDIGAMAEKACNMTSKID